MKKIIFLDIDGVLNVHYKEKDQFGHVFHKQFEDNLNYIIEQTNAKIVISSTWKMNGLTILQDMWKQRNMLGEIIDITPNEVDIVAHGTVEFYDQVDRGYEIQQWLDTNKVESYCIIDDINDMLPTQQNNFVKTSNNYQHTDSVNGYGLTKICAEKVIQILKILNRNNNN